MGLSSGLDSSIDVRLTLTTLGAARLLCARNGSTAVPVFGPGKPLALLVYLCLSPRRIASREHLVGLLWADSEFDRAFHALRQTVWHVGRLVGERILVTRNGEVELVAPIALDRDAFLHAVEAGDWESAVGRYTGDFLPGFAAPGGSAFEQWAELERIRLRMAFLRSAESLVRLHLSRGHIRDAQSLARRARDTDRLYESGWRLLLETLIAGEDWTAAAMEADALSHMLEVEDLEPEPATRAALARALQVPAGSERREHHGLVAELVGREREFATILEAWGFVRQGRARHVHVVAPAGMGKTRLLRDVLARLRAGGSRAVYVRAHPGERAIPFTFAAELAGALAALPGAAAVSPGAAATLVTLNPRLTSQYPMRPDPNANADALRQRIIAVAELVTAVSDEAPVALLLDDLHWVDPDSRQVMGALAARLDGQRALMVTAARPTGDVMIHGSDATILRLGPLSEELVAQLVGSIAALPDAPWAHDLPPRLTQATRGSPLLVLESLKHALDSEVVTLEDGTWTCREPSRLLSQIQAGTALQRRLEEQDPTSQLLLITLAVAGTPVSLGAVARAASRSEDAVEPLLVALEERGLASRAGSAWEIAHDEVAALILERAVPGTVERARLSLGKALATDVGTDAAVARQAGRLLAAVGEEAVLSSVFRTWLRHRRGQGDHRPPRDLAVELLGDVAHRDSVRRLVASLPPLIRLGLDLGRRRLAVALPALALGVAAVVAVTRPALPEPDAALLAFVRTADGDAAWRADLRRDAWSPDDEVQLEPARSAVPLVPAALGASAPLARAPAADSWIFERVFDDSGGIELVQRLDDGHAERRLTFASGDDGAPSWAPDGSAIAFTTARWNALSHSDVALLELADASVRPLTLSDAADSYPRWAPDGTRVAFGRRSFDGALPEVCVGTVDGTALRCSAVDAGRAPVVLGWRDADQVVFEWDSAGTVVRDAMQAGSGVRSRIDGPVGGTASLSPDGEWMLWLGTEPGNGVRGWYVWPLDAPEARRALGGVDLADAELVWDAMASVPPYIDTLRITSTPGPVPHNAGYLLTAIGIDAVGRMIVPRALAWRSADSTIATVDTSGVLLPKGEGDVWIHGSAGGWRADSVLVAIATSQAGVVWSESWAEGFGERWIPFGEPRPEILMGDHGTALWSAGDSSFSSGVYTRQGYEGLAGLGVEARVSGRVSSQQWQWLALSLDAALDPDRLEEWDHRTGGLPRSAPLSCGVAYPRQEGFGGTDYLRFGCGTTILDVPAPVSLREGAWHLLRLQLLPDGRLGFALDGVPLGLTRSPVTLQRTFRIVVEGQSHGARFLVGDVEVWTGVRQDVDWRVLDGVRR